MLNRLFPIEHVKSIKDVDYDRLFKAGYDTFLFDYDFTLAPWGDLKIRPETVRIFEKLRAMGANVFVVTNAKKERVNHLKDKFPWLEVYWSMRKPSIRKLHEILRMKGIDPRRCVIIGDLFLTDVLAGNRLGMYTIMVNPMLYEAMKLYKRIIGFLGVILYRILFFTFGWFFRIGALISPNEWKDTVRDIDYDSLIEHGFKVFIFDFDNTLAPWGSYQILPENEELLRDLSKKARVLIASNARRREVKTDFEVIWRSYKPLGCKVRRRLREMKVDFRRVVVIGDQLFTDVFFGSLLGAYTIKVKPIQEEEAFITKCNRCLEKIFSRTIVKKPKVSGDEECRTM